MSETERRATDPQCWDAALVMGLMYTFVYALAICAVTFVDIPDSNGDIMKVLMGAMTVIQTTIVQYFFGTSKSGQDSQKLIAQSKERTDNVLREVVTAVTPATQPKVTP